MGGGQGTSALSRRRAGGRVTANNAAYRPCSYRCFSFSFNH